MSSPRLSIAIVNWNSGAHLRDCLSTIERETRTPYEVLILDNASCDGSAKGIETGYSNVSVLWSSTNLGFATGVNLLLPRAQGDYVVLLNPDTLILHRALDRLADFMVAHPSAGAVGPTLRHPTGRYQVQNGGWQPTIWTVLAHYSGLTRLVPGLHGLHTTRDTTQRVGWLSGACLMVRREAVTMAGPLHEDWFLYGEDVEWCDRIGRDWELWYLSEAKVLHLDRQSTKRRGRAFSTLWAVGLHHHYVRRGRPNRLQLLAFDTCMAAGLLSRACLYAGRAVWSRRTDPWLPEAVDFVHGAWDLIRLSAVDAPGSRP